MSERSLNREAAGIYPERSVTFCVIVESKEARSGSKGNPIITRAGEKFVVINGRRGITSQNFVDVMPTDTLPFSTREEAEKFAMSWKGHPWYCIPSGKYEVVEVEPIYKQVLVGYRKSKGGPS